MEYSGIYFTELYYHMILKLLLSHIKIHLYYYSQQVALDSFLKIRRRYTVGYTSLAKSRTSSSRLDWGRFNDF